MTDYEKLSQLLMPFLQPNTYLILQGKLGAGKTTLVQFLTKKLGIKEKITSPTFNILERYQIRKNYYLNHFDFFRLASADNLDFLIELTTDNLNIIERREINYFQLLAELKNQKLAIVDWLNIQARLEVYQQQKIKKGDEKKQK
ncbi:17576_t:CDS:2 [Racocetra fulgida]|uniref:tRNA threonylcarbamoyladenosine biosynthesis protein TsaE n=1 Tax=Racocetra fulgida TaxID=60492 RepID=A0A9N9HQN8_9GLOM|nr:17576_t:CDS:2 [Racocetra fulgida]